MGKRHRQWHRLGKRLGGSAQGALWLAFGFAVLFSGIAPNALHAQAAFNEWLPEKKLILADSPYYGRKLEPRGRRIVHGAGQALKEFRIYHDTMGAQRPAMMMVYRNMISRSGRFRGIQKQLDSLPDSYIIPQIGINLPKDSVYVASEEYIRQLDRTCEGLKALGRPAYLRLGYEFNGEWNGYSPEVYKSAWRRFAEALRRHGLDSMATVWCYATEGMHKDFMSFYPGDEYVDWWGIDLFSPEHFAAGDTKRFLDEARARRFPVMIGESTPRWVTAVRGEVSWRSWFQQYFRLMANYPHIKAFSYITYNWADYYKVGSSLHDWGDARVWEDSLVFSRWKKTLENPVFVHAQSRDSLRLILGLASSAPKTNSPKAAKSAKTSPTSGKPLVPSK